MPRSKGQEFNNRSQGQRLRRNNERAMMINDVMDQTMDLAEKQSQVNADLYALTMQNERSIKAMNVRLTAVEREMRSRNEVEQDWQ